MVKCESAIRLPVYGFLLMVNSNIWPNVAPLQDICVQNMSNLEFDHSRSLQVKSNGAVGLPICDFLLVSNSNYMSNSHRLGVIATNQKFSNLLPLGPKFDPSTHHPYPEAIFLKIESLHL